MDLGLFVIPPLLIAFFFLMMAWQIDRIKNQLDRMTDMLMSLPEVRKRLADAAEYHRAVKIEQRQKRKGWLKRFLRLHILP